jgi:hypothetical protein
MFGTRFLKLEPEQRENFLAVVRAILNNIQKERP